MDFRVLGPLEVWDGKRQVALGAHKQRALLAVLLAHSNQTLTRDRLIHLLWGDDSPESAGHALQVYVSNLRKVLKRDLLVSDSGGYRLNAPSELTDIARFEVSATEGRRKLEQRQFQAASDELGRALEMWRGKPFAEFDPAPFARGAAERLEELRLSVIEDRVDADLALGRHANLIAELRRLAADFPLRERLQGQLMLALYRSGRQAEASEVFQLTRTRLVDELGMEPGKELQELLKRILNQDPGLDLAKRSTIGRRHNLPRFTTSLISRDDAIRELRGLIAEHRLVTLTGAGGVGKTRLAVAVAEDVVDSFPGGAWLVDLAPVDDPLRVTEALVETLAIPRHSRRNHMRMLVDFLQDRPTLVVLDNCEHLVSSVTRTVVSLLAECERLKVVVTSREILGVAGEQAWRVPSLPVGSARDGAVALFGARARDRRSGFAIDIENLADVEAICTALDGIPLAIELAAARVDALTPAEIRARLNDRFRLLTSGSRAAVSRQRTLEATVDWSYRLLTPQERLVLGRLSVFSGGCTLEAAEAVCAAGEVEKGAVLDLVNSLVAKSFVSFEPLGGSSRYLLLETIRQYAYQKLGDGETTELVRASERHATFFLTLAEEANLVDGRADTDVWLRRLAAEADNLRVALQWLSVHKDSRFARLAMALDEYWWPRGLLEEGLRWCGQAIAEGGRDALTRSRLCRGMAIFHGESGNFDDALPFAQQGLEYARESSDPLTIARALNTVAFIRLGRDEKPSNLLPLLEEALPLARSAGSPWAAVLLSNFGFVYQTMGRTDTAKEFFAQAVETPNANPRVRAQVLGSLGFTALESGDTRAAAAQLGLSLQMFHELEDPIGLCYVLLCLACLAANVGDVESAIRVEAAVVHLQKKFGGRNRPYGVHYETSLQLAHETVDAETLRRLTAEAEAMSYAAAVASAMAIVRSADETPSLTGNVGSGRSRNVP